MRLKSGSQIRDLRDCLIRGVWECNSFHQLGLTHFQLSYLCNVFQMAEIYTPKASILYLESYLKPSETMKAFKQNKSFSLSFFNTKAGGIWHTIATKKKRFHFNPSEQKLDSYLG